MVYNLVLFSSNLGEIDIERGFDKRPLRFIDKSYAEREAREKNLLLIKECGQDCNLTWKVVEEK